MQEGRSKIEWLKNHLAQILAITGLVLMILGLTLIPYQFLSFSMNAAILIMLGGATLAVSFAIHSRISRRSSNIEKIFVSFVCASITLFASAIALYTVVEVQWIARRMVIPRGPFGEPILGAIPIVKHIYSNHSVLLITIAIGLILGAIYIKSQI
jgi:hypothetical protein